MRNFMLLSTLVLLTVTACKNQAPTINLFNGKDLTGWGMITESGDPSEVFTANPQQEYIHVKGFPFGYLYTEESYQNFELHVEWCYPDSATNSGIFLFVKEPMHVWPTAIECQLCATKAGDFVLLGGAELNEFQLAPGEERPAFPVVEKFEASNEKPVGEWNCADITALDGTITVKMNGILQNKATLPAPTQGRIALQSEGADILFRNIQLTPLP